MAEKKDAIWREDAIKACDEKAWMRGEDIIGVRYPTYDEIRATIETLPSADVVEVVRCKDCKHRSIEEKDTYYHWCNELNWGVTENDYCSLGERE